MASDLTIPEERKNVIRKLQQIGKICCLEQDNSYHAFELLMKAWDKFSEKLWYLGYWNDYLQGGEIVLTVAKTLNYMSEQGQLFAELGWLLMEWEHYQQAEEYFKASLQNYQLVNYCKGQSKLLRYLGVLYHRKKSLKIALEYYQKALNIVIQNSGLENHDEILLSQEAELHNLIGSLNLDLQNFNESITHLKLSLQNYEKLGEKWRYYQAAPLLNLGKLYRIQLEYDKAKQYYQDCLQLCKDIKRTDMEAGVLLRMAELAEAKGNDQEALQLANQSELVAGTEIKSVRNQAALFKERLLKKLDETV